MLDVCLLGTGGMMPLPKRWLTALMTRFNGSSLLIDCGEGTQIAIKQKGWSVHDIDVICFTHYHADHISGLPGLLLSMGNAQREKPLTLVGPRGLVKVVDALRVIAPELPFLIEYIELTEKTHTLYLYGYRLEAFRANHNIVCYGYNINIDRAGKFQVEKAVEYQVPKNCWGKLQRGETVEVDGRQITPDMVLGEARKGIKVTYCTDTRPTPLIVESAKDADLLICEGMYGEPEKIQKAKENKHMMFTEAAKIARDSNAAVMWLTHYSPSLIRPDIFMDDVWKIFPNAKPGRDGKTVELKFKD